MDEDGGIEEFRRLTMARNNVRVQINERALAQLQQDANAEVQAVIRGVNVAMGGQDVNEVKAELDRRLRALGVSPNPAAVLEYAQGIADGTLTE
jgi:hypothetical protein